MCLRTGTHIKAFRVEILHSGVIAVIVKQVVFDKSSVGIGILFRVLATEWLSLVFCESVMADHLLGLQN